MSKIISIPAWYYQQHDADFSHDVPEENFGGWKRADLEFALDRSAVTVMHAWDCGTPADYPGWYRAVPYIPRAAACARDVFPELLEAVRRSPLPLIHIVANSKYYQELPGYRKARELAGQGRPPYEQVASDPVRDRLLAFKAERVWPGAHNAGDVNRGFERVDFDPHARPLDTEYVCENGDQLFAVCKELGINHLVYTGFAIDGCLLTSPGGMLDMIQRGAMCSVLRQATVAIENKETARTQMGKEIALWRVALLFGFVYDVNDFIAAVTRPTA